MKENYVDFRKLDINPRIMYAAKQCGLLSCEGILYGSSRHCHPSRRLSPSDHSSLVAAVAAMHCPALLSCFDLLQLQCKSSTAAAKTVSCNNNRKLYSNIQDVTCEAAAKRSKTENLDSNSSISAFYTKKSLVPSSNADKLSSSSNKINSKSKDCISSTRQQSSYSSKNDVKTAAEDTPQPLADTQKCDTTAKLLPNTTLVQESNTPIPSQQCFDSSLPDSNALMKCRNSLQQIPLCSPNRSSPIELCPAPIIRSPTKSCPSPPPCPDSSSPCLAPASQCPEVSSQRTTTSAQHTATSQCTIPLPRHLPSSPQRPAPFSLCTIPLPQCPGPVFRCPKLASDLHGLFAPGSLVEVCGESGSGKTQLALSLALNTVLPKESGGLASKVAYLCTEGQFPSSRLQQMVAAVNRSGAAEVQHTAVADAIMVQHIPDLLSLSNSIRYQLPALLRRSRPPLALVLLDSVAAPFRAEASDWRWTERQTRLHHLGHSLRILATEHHCSVLVINQVTARYGLPDLYGQGDEDDVTPALGLAWSNLVTSRLMLHRTLPTATTCHQLDAEEGRPEGTPLQSPVPRTMQLLFCPWLPRRTIPFVVAADGVQGVTA